MSWRARGFTFAAIFVLAALAASAPALAACPTAFHARKGNFRFLSAGPNNQHHLVGFYNYDSPTATCARANNVEWPLDLIFYNNASIPTINQVMTPYFPYGKPFASTEYLRLNNGHGRFWAADGGRKTAAQSAGTSDDHYRLYAEIQYRNYSVSLGFFVLGSMHKDYNEAAGITNARYGNSELAEKDFFADASAQGQCCNWKVYHSLYDMRNREPFRVEGNHIWRNDGRATIVVMP